MLAVIFDTETNGLNPEDSSVLEIAAAIVCLKTKRILKSFSAILNTDPSVSCINNGTDTSKIHRITDELLEIARQDQFKNVEFFRKCFFGYPGVEVAIAHNIEFDTKMLNYHFPSLFPSELKTLCTVIDADWGVTVTGSRKLSHLCADLGVPVISVHSAMGDVTMLTSAVLSMPDPVDFVKEMASEKKFLIAHVPFAEKDLAKQAGFSWDGPSKQWFLKCSVSRIQEKLDSLPFNCSTKDSL